MGMGSVAAAAWQQSYGSMTEPDTGQMLEILRATIVTLVRRIGPDLSAPQLGLVLVGYFEDRDHTVRRLADDLTISNRAVTGGLERLESLDLLRREVNPCNRRSIIVRRTPKGSAFLRDVRKIIRSAAASTEAVAAAPSRRTQATNAD
jgi:DNA-binding MarR family transcriptional regulator